MKYSNPGQQPSAQRARLALVSLVSLVNSPGVPRVLGQLGRVGVLGLACLGLSLTPSWAQADTPGDDYADGSYGRVRYQINGLTIERASSSQLGNAGLNSPIFPGDSVRTEFDQRVEVELAGGSLVRIDRTSAVTFLALPDPYASVQDNIVLQLAKGALRIVTPTRIDGEFRVDTPAGSAYLSAQGDYRIEVYGHGSTRLISRRGVAELVGRNGSVLVRGGMRADVDPGALPDTPTAFNTFAADGFDRWVEERELAYREPQVWDNDALEAYEALPGEVRPHYRELVAYGDWSHDDEYGYVWYPRVKRGWRPYYDGYWRYGPRGYFWVGAEPWGWAPYRYGRWVHGVHGWGWVPGRVFGGAWVAWSWGSLHVGWAPLGYWNRPVYYGPRLYGYYDPLCWTFVRYSHLYHYDYHRPHRYYHDRYTVHDIGDPLRDTAVVTRPPRVAPERLAEPTTRQAALREVQATRQGVTAPQNRRAENSFVAQERRSAPSNITVPQGRSSVGESVNRTRPSSATTRSSSTPARTRTQSSSGELRSYPRRLTTPSETRPGASRAEPRSQPEPRSRRNDGSRLSPSERSGPAESRRSVRPSPRQSTTDRREIYRRMAEPRTTQRSSERSSTGVRTPSRRSSDSVRSQPTTPRRSSPSAAPRRTAPSRSTTAPRRSTSSSSRSKAAPRQSPSRKKAAPKRSSSSSSRPKAAPRRAPAKPKSSGKKSGSSSRSRGSSSRRGSGNRR